MSTPQDSSGQHQPPDPTQQQVYGQPTVGQQPGYPSYPPQQQYQGYVAPKNPLDLAKLVTIGAWVVLALYALDFLYRLGQDEIGPDFADRFFGGMPGLGQGIGWAGVLLAIGVWLRRNQGSA